MLSELLSTYINASSTQIAEWLQFSPSDLHKDEGYAKLLSEVNTDALGKSMAVTREYLDGELPRLVEHYSEKHSMEHFPLTGYMASNWVVGYLTSPASLPAMLNHHTNVSRDVMRDVLPELLEVYGSVPEYAEEWQRAFATIVIPLITVGK